MRPENGFRIDQLNRQHNRAGFNCGVESLDEYFRRLARQDVRRDIASVDVLNDEASARVAGYFTLSASVVHPHDLPTSIRDQYPRYPELPAILLGRLAVDRDYQNRQLGRYLLTAALRVAFHATRQVAAMAVTVDAIDEGAAAFYRRHGFVPYPSRPLSLFLLMSSVAQLAE